jgi:hypothetical protein
MDFESEWNARGCGRLRRRSADEHRLRCDRDPHRGGVPAGQANDAIRGRTLDEKPYSDTERARIGGMRDVPVEIVVNGSVAGRQVITADGKLHELKFEVPIKQSSWIAARVLPAAHTNPVFALVGGKPVRAPRARALSGA